MLTNLRKWNSIASTQKRMMKMIILLHNYQTALPLKEPSILTTWTNIVGRKLKARLRGLGQKRSTNNKACLLDYEEEVVLLKTYILRRVSCHLENSL